MTASVRGLSAAQLALWAEQQVDPDVSSSGYFAVTLVGPLEAGRPRAAATAVLHRHEPLRSVLRLTEGAVRRLVLPVAVALSYASADLPCAEGDEHAAVREWMRRGESRRRWDLEIDPPLRFHELAHGPDRRTLVFSVHHAGFDGRSKFVVAQDFARALADPGALGNPLPDVVPPEADEETVAAAVGHWPAVLDGEVEPLALQGGRTPARRGIVSSETTELDPADVAALRDLAERCGTSTFTVLLAALGRQLAAYGNTRPVLAVAADISDERTAGVAGVQINVVPLALECDPDAPAPGAVAAAAAALGRLHRFRRVPFRTLLRALPDRSARRLMTQLGVSFPRPPRGLELEVPGLRCAWDFFTPNTSATFDKTLQLRADWPRVRVRLDHRAETMDAPGAAAFVEHFREAVGSLAAGPPPRFRAAVAGAAAAVPVQRDPRQLLHEWAAERPRTAALVTGGEVLDHAALARGHSRHRLVAELATADDSVVRTAEAVAERSSARPGDLVVVSPDVVPPELVVEALAAWIRGATLVVHGGPTPPEGRIRRVVGRWGFLRGIAAADRVVPVRELHTAGVAHYVAAGAVVGRLDPSADPLVPPLLTPVPGCVFTVRTATGRELPARVPGALWVRPPGASAPRDTGDCGRITGDGAVEYLGPRSGRWLRHHGFVDVPLVTRVLHAHPSVGAASVELRSTRGRLAAVASVVPADPADPPAVEAVRAHLRHHLDGFDVPGRIEVAAKSPPAEGDR